MAKKEKMIKVDTQKYVKHFKNNLSTSIQGSMKKELQKEVENLPVFNEGDKVRFNADAFLTNCAFEEDSAYYKFVKDAIDTNRVFTVVYDPIHVQIAQKNETPILLICFEEDNEFEDKFGQKQYKPIEQRWLTYIKYLDKVEDYENN